MTIHVYHLGEDVTLDQRYDAMTGFSTGHASACAALWLAGKYDLVAEVDTTDQDAAYHLTNNITHGWDDPEYMPATVRAVELPSSARYQTGHRSTSVGDVLVDGDGAVSVVSSFGFTKLDVPPHHPAVRLQPAELSPAMRAERDRLDEGFFGGAVPAIELPQGFVGDDEECDEYRAAAANPGAY